MANRRVHNRAEFDDAGPPCLAPVFDQTPHLEHEQGLRCWFVEPLGVVTQLARPVHANMDMAHFLTDVMDPRLHALTTDPRASMYFIHDWRNLTGYDTETRKHLTEWGLRLRSRIRALIVVQNGESPALARMGVSVAFTAMRMAGLDAQIGEDIQKVVLDLGLRPHPHAR